jgi:alkylated DNA repair dioxygenase AlkB
LDVPTNSGEMLIMGGDFQKEFTHEIPIEKKIKHPRISFTFRKHTE